MATIMESAATAVLLILLILLFSHMLNGTASSWISSKFKAASA
jgi:hypothetical protein